MNVGTNTMKTRNASKGPIAKAVAASLKTAAKDVAQDRALRTASAKKPKIVVAPEPKNTTMDGFLRASEVESPCWLVWNLADTMKGARRKDVIAAAEKAGVAHYTARTQYQHWYTAHKNSKKK